MKQQSLIRSFRVAFNGIGHFFMNDRNGNIHLTITVLVAAAGYYFRISIIEWCIVFLCVAVVFGLEMLNHALEKLCDAVHPTQHPLIGISKDVAAGAVLWSVIISVIIGMMIFLPKIFL